MRVHRRKWDVSIFDLYSLVAMSHPTSLPAELLQLFLGKVNLEVEVLGEDFSDAADRVDAGALCFIFAAWFRPLRHLAATCR
jgi:hypothetical protein